MLVEAVGAQPLLLSQPEILATVDPVQLQTALPVDADAGDPVARADAACGDSACDEQIVDEFLGWLEVVDGPARSEQGSGTWRPHRN